MTQRPRILAFVLALGAAPTAARAEPTTEYAPPANDSTPAPAPASDDTPAPALAPASDDTPAPAPAGDNTPAPASANDETPMYTTVPSNTKNAQPPTTATPPLAPHAPTTPRSAPIDENLDTRRQSRRVRGTLYASAAVGPSLLFASTDSSTDARSFEGTAVAVSLAVGLKMGDHFALGVTYLRDEFLSMSSEDEVSDADEPDLDDIGFSFDRAGILLELFPVADSGLHFQGFLGYGDLNTHRPDGVEADDPSGTVLGLAGGYEWLVSESVHIGALLRLNYAPLTVDETGNDKTDLGAFLPSALVTAAYH